MLEVSKKKLLGICFNLVLFIFNFCVCVLASIDLKNTYSNNKCDNFENNNNVNLFGINANIYSTQNGQSEDSISPEEEDDDDDEEEEETSDQICLTNDQLITSESSATPDTTNKSQYFLNQAQQQYKGGLSNTTQSMISTIDQTNFILKEQQQRSINGDTFVETRNEKSNDVNTASPSNSNNNDLNILSSGSSSVSSSMSSPVILSNSEQNTVETHEEEEEVDEEQNNLMHADYFDSNKLIDFEERFVLSFFLYLFCLGFEANVLKNFRF